MNGEFINHIKQKQTCIEKYGVEHVMQVEEIFNKQQKASYRCKKYNDKLHYLSKYEEYFLNLINDLGLINNVQNGFAVRYIYNDKNKIYFPDFILEVNNKKYIIEIKSSWT